MAVAALAALNRLQLSEALRRQLGVPPGPLTLRRAWPRGDDRMALELVTAGGVILAGQSFTRADATSDNQRAARVARRSQTTVPTATAVALPGTGVVLQAGGADRRLPALATVVADPAATLVAHRPERRAVVRLDSDAADEVLAAPLEPRSGEAAGGALRQAGAPGPQRRARQDRPGGVHSGLHAHPPSCGPRRDPRPGGVHGPGRNQP